MHWNTYGYPVQSPYYMIPIRFYHPYQIQEGWQTRPYPPVNPSMFTSSATEMHQLMKKADALVQKLANTSSFAKDVMDAAQNNEKQKVNQLLKSTGLDSGMKTTYTPDGLKIILTSEVNNIDCCHLTISLKW
jgi:hypothetical protein